MTSSDVTKGTDRLFDLFLLFFLSPLSNPANLTVLVDFTVLGANLFLLGCRAGVKTLLLQGRKCSLLPGKWL
jgi:hypothetical protein